MLQLNPRQRRRPAVQLSSSRCSEVPTLVLVTPLTLLTQRQLLPTRPTCAQLWRSSTNISTSTQSTIGSFLHPTTPPAVALSVLTPSLSLHLLLQENLSATRQLTRLTI